jgi:hypothetical protein
MDKNNSLQEMNMKLELLRSDTLRIFDENINQEIIGDLNILDKIQPETHGNGCSVPTAMVILSALDFIGYLISENGNLRNSGRYIEKSFKYNDCFPRVTYTDEVIKTLICFYRHGMMHSFYPIRTSSIVYGIHKSNQTDLFEVIAQHGQDVTSLNVNVLSNDFKNFFNRLRDELSTTTSDYILKTIAKRFQLVGSMVSHSSTATRKTTIPIGIKTP